MNNKERLTKELELMALDILDSARTEDLLKVKLDAFAAVVKYQQVVQKLGDDDGNTANPIDEIRQELETHRRASSPEITKRRGRPRLDA